jgi:hypothetical protein
MAKNLRAKIPAEDTLFVHDVNTAATKKFLGSLPMCENLLRKPYV